MKTAANEASSLVVDGVVAHIIREAGASDVPAIFQVRTSVVENLLTEEELETIGITRRSITNRIESGEAKAWCAEVNPEVAAFSRAFRDQREVPGLWN